MFNKNRVIRQKPNRLFGFNVQNKPDIEPEQTINQVSLNNPYIVDAECNKYGILERIDAITGEDTNEDLSLAKKIKEVEIKEDPIDNTKFKPGERLLMTIKRDKPELIHEYKKITTKRKNKLKQIRDKLHD